MSEEPLRSCEFDSKDLIVKLDLQFPAEMSALAGVVAQVMDVIREIGCARTKEFDVELALHEALVNAVVHGCRKDTNKLIQLTVCCDKSRGLLMIVRDPGPGFDVNSIPSPVRGQNLFSSGGRGIFLINRLMDEVQFLEGGTEIRMLKRSDEPGASPHKR
ncbi:MAG: ATP-binding protein [Acidobacteria bacterium]|nr:MAG: ATP-binding protein [Acidobacteriota bacterium]